MTKDDIVFWIVWRIGTTPSAFHYTEEDANAEATRLAKKNPGVAFYVLKADKYYSTPMLVEKTILTEITATED